MNELGGHIRNYGGLTFTLTSSMIVLNFKETNTQSALAITHMLMFIISTPFLNYAGHLLPLTMLSYSINRILVFRLNWTSRNKG
jgi:hypothetical protein